MSNDIANHRKPILDRTGLFIVLMSGLLVVGCDDRAASTAMPMRAPESLPGPSSSVPVRVPPIQIVAGQKPIADLQSFQLSKSVALVAHEGMPYIAQARYCWPSFRFRGEVEPSEQRLADQVLANSDLPLPPQCTPEPKAVTEYVAKLRDAFPKPGQPIPEILPLTPMTAFVGLTGYYQVAQEGCTGALRNAKGLEMRRRWRTDVRIQRTGDPTIDGTFATVLADARFQRAMGKIKVSLVSERPNLLIVPNLSDVCREGKRPYCGARDESKPCAMFPDDRAREALARRASGGRNGFFPDANDFLTDRPIGVGLDGFTIGDSREITGAVCIGITRVSPVDRQLNASICLLRALGIAGERSPMPVLFPVRRSQIIELADFNSDSTTLYTTAFKIIGSMYGESGRS